MDTKTIIPLYEGDPKQHNRRLIVVESETQVHISCEEYNRESWYPTIHYDGDMPLDWHYRHWTSGMDKQYLPRLIEALEEINGRCKHCGHDEFSFERTIPGAGYYCKKCGKRDGTDENNERVDKEMMDDFGITVPTASGSEE